MKMIIMKEVDVGIGIDNILVLDQMVESTVGLLQVEKPTPKRLS